MEILKVIWNKLSGKKTTIGAILLAGAKVLSMLGENEWADVVTQIAQLIEAAGWGAVTVGLADKASKELNKE